MMGASRHDEGGALTEQEKEQEKMTQKWRFRDVREWIYRNRFAFFLVSLITLNFLAPYLWGAQRNEWLTYLMGAVLLLVLIYTTKIIKQYPYLFYLIVLCGGVSVILHAFAYSHALMTLAMLCYFFFLLPVTVILFIELFIKPQQMSLNLLFGVISLYWLIGLIFAKIFIILQLILPGSLVDVESKLNLSMGLYDYYYFSYITLTTIGYGDIVAITIPAKALVIIESFVGLFYVAITVARFVVINIYTQPYDTYRLMIQSDYYKIHKQLENSYLIYFLLIIILMFLSYFSETSRVLEWFVISVGTIATLLLSYYIFFARRKKRIFYVVVFIAFLGCFLGLVGQSNISEIIAYILMLIYLLPIIIKLLHDIILKERLITRDILLGSVFLFWLLGVYFAFIYSFINGIYPNALILLDVTPQHATLTWPDYFYFSYMTLTTVGFGDIVPNVDQVKSIAVFEGIIGVFYLAILVARLVLLYVIEQQKR